MRSWRERQAAKVDRFIARLTAESEFFGLIGEGYPNSFYKVYVRQASTSRRWWRFELSAGPSNVDPIKHQGRVQVSWRVPAMWAPLPFLADYTHKPDNHAIAKLLARAVELRALAQSSSV